MVKMVGNLDTRDQDFYIRIGVAPTLDAAADDQTSLLLCLRCMPGPLKT